MKTVFLSLGSNLGDRRGHLRFAIAELKKAGLENIKVAPVYETRALLLDDAPAEWDMPFLNTVLTGQTSADAHLFLQTCQQIEIASGRQEPHPRWSPRPLDIDILLWGDDCIDTPELQVPHPEITRRAFVLDPLNYLAPNAMIHGKPVRDWARAHPQHQPLWFGIMNATPDSFSDGGELDVAQTATQWLAENVPVFDIGAESTRPGATPLTNAEEWARLQPVLEVLHDHKTDPLFAKLSIDTYHPATAEKVLDWGVDIVNDVSGVHDPRMMALAAESDALFIAMHNLGIPADKKNILDTSKTDATTQIMDWLKRQMDMWQEAGIDLNRMIFDPGVGFGKNAPQSLEILRQIETFYQTPLRLFVGHSRKSFMNAFTDVDYADRDFETLGTSLQLAARGVDMLRVHNASAHMRAFRAWSAVLK